MPDFLENTEDDAVIEWRVRRDTVIELARDLEEDTYSPEISERLIQFVEDEKWEVRAEVAKALVWVCESSLPAFQPLFTDRNGFVAKDAKNALARRNLIMKNAAKQEVSESRLFKNVERLKRKYGYGSEVAEAAKEDALDAIQLMMGFFVHDIRGVVAPIPTCQDMMYNIVERKLDALELCKFNKEMMMVNRRVKMIEDLAEDVRELSKRIPKEKMQEDIKEIISTAVDDTERLFEGKNRDISMVSFSTEGVPSGIMIPVVRPAIIRALMNLLKNAVESYMPTQKAAKEGVVEISATKVENGVKIFIRDYGIGMTDRELKILRQFLPRCTSRKKKGTGLGLAIAYTKIKDHGGTLELDSEGCDKGSTVTIYLPEKKNE
jgi:signal transduction histidine kinase